ncbi:hypothetical protein T484DRAFT_1807818, partial [Baffinella frigidus]
ARLALVLLSQHPFPGILARAARATLQAVHSAMATASEEPYGGGDATAGGGGGGEGGGGMLVAGEGGGVEVAGLRLVFSDKTGDVPEVAGLRLAFSDKTGDVTVAAVVQGTPAASRGGIEEGDRVLMVDGITLGRGDLEW